jgi:hypothetical protein
MGRRDDDGCVEIIALIFIAVLGPLAVFYGADSR